MTHQVSFDPKAMTILREIMSKIEADFDTVDDSMRQTIAARIMSMAGDGETDEEKIRAHALEILEQFAPTRRNGFHD